MHMLPEPVLRGEKRVSERSHSKVTNPGLPDRAGMRGRQVRGQGARFEEALAGMTPSVSPSLNAALLP